MPVGAARKKQKPDFSSKKKRVGLSSSRNRRRIGVPCTNMRSSSRLLARVAAPRLGPAAFVGSSSRSIYSVPYSELSVGVPKESASMEKRVGQTPESVAKLVKEGITVKVEAGAGAAADFSDAAYEKAGASVVSRDEAWGASLVTKVPSLLLPSPAAPVRCCRPQN